MEIIAPSPIGITPMLRCPTSIDFESTPWGNLRGDPGLARRLRGIWNLVTAPPTCGCGSVGDDGGYLMKRSTTLVTTLFALASFPLLAQQPPPDTQPTRPAAQQPSGTEPASPTSPAASQQAPPIEMSSVNGELVSKLD